MKNVMRMLLTLWLVAMAVLSHAAQESITYIHTDHLGSPILATNQSGAVVWREDYQPHGTQLVQTDADNQVGFTGHLDEKTLGVTYMQGRWYHPGMGRFMALDPVGFVEGSPQSFNRYAYANNNPYKYIDPDGRSPVDVAFLVYDIGKLGVAVYTGAGIGEAALDVASSVAGVVSPVPGAGQAIKTARVADKVADASRAADNAAVVAKEGLSSFSRASEFGVQSYKDLKKLTKGTDLEAHHLVEQRFAKMLGVKLGDMASIALTKAEHQSFTNAWRQAIPYGQGTANATRDQVMNAAKQIYKDHPDILKSLGL